MRILPTLLCAMGTVSALDINAFMAKLKTDSPKSSKKSGRKNSSADLQLGSVSDNLSSKKARKRSRTSTMAPTTRLTTRTTKPVTRAPVTTKRPVPTRGKVVPKRPWASRRPGLKRPVGRPFAAGKATRRPNFRGRPVQRTTQDTSRKMTQPNPTVFPFITPPPNNRRPNTTGTTKTPKPEGANNIAPEMLARRHYKANPVLSAGGRLFGYRSMIEDVVETEAVKNSPFTDSEFNIAIPERISAQPEKRVFSARNWSFASGGRSNLATSCWTCHGRTYQECLNNGSAVTCGVDQTSCYVREYTQNNDTNGNSNLIIYMGCQNIFQCVKDFNNNNPPVAEGRSSQPTVNGFNRMGNRSTAAACVPGIAGSVCHQCCAGDNNCNSSWASTALSTIAEWTDYSHTQTNSTP